MPVQTLIDFLTNQKGTVARKFASEIRKLGPTYRKVPVKELRHRVSIVLSSLENSLTRCDVEGHIIDINPAMQRFLGRRREHFPVSHFHNREGAS